jgi:lipopolysaccharide transport system ATP-binding protein
MMSHNEQTVLELRHVAFHFIKRKGYFSKQKFWAIKDVSFTLNKGECLGVIGRNGAGKTTLLQMLAGIIRPDEGAFVNHGFSTTLLSLQVGFIPYLTGRENTMLNGLYLGLRKSFIKHRMADILDFSELGDFFDQPISAYSAGMRARLGFSIAFQLDPDVLLIDEVLGVGDAAFREKSTEKMNEKIKSNKTVVIVSHSPSTIRDLCNRAVWIENGVSMAEGDPAEVLEAYTDFIKQSQNAKSN